MRVISYPSPNFNRRPDGRKPDMIVLHYTGMKTTQEALDRLCNPSQDQENGRVSAHFTIDLNGDIYAHIHPDKRAWHAGESKWDDRENINDYSIGIELVNKGHELGYHEFPEEQIAALIKLMHKLFKQYEIPLRNVVGHEDIAPIRKMDPGELFPWKKLVAEGLAVPERVRERYVQT